FRARTPSHCSNIVWARIFCSGLFLINLIFRILRKIYSGLYTEKVNKPPARREMKEKPVNSENCVWFSPRICVSAVLILHLIIVLPFAFILNIWSDEASTLYTTE